MKTRIFTMNSKDDRYARTNEREPTILVKFRYKEQSGEVTDVGTFHLDLVALEAKGVVTNRMTAKGEVFDIEIVKRRGTFWLQVREGTSIPLDRFKRVR